MLVWFWCKFGATLYQTILTIFTISHDITRYYTIFTISNGVAKTPRDNYPFGIISIQKQHLLRWVLFFCRSVSFWACRPFPSKIPSALCLTLLCSSTSLRSAQDDTTEKHEAKPSGISERLRRAVQFVKNPAVLFTFGNFYDIITLGSYLLDKLEFV